MDRVVLAEASIGFTFSLLALGEFCLVSSTLDSLAIEEKEMEKRAVVRSGTEEMNSTNAPYCVRDVLTLFYWRCFQVGGRVSCCGGSRRCGSGHRVYWHCTSLWGRQAGGARSTSANAILSR